MIETLENCYKVGGKIVVDLDNSQVYVEFGVANTPMKKKLIFSELYNDDEDFEWFMNFMIDNDVFKDGYSKVVVEGAFIYFRCKRPLIFKNKPYDLLYECKRLSRRTYILDKIVCNDVEYKRV